MEHKKINGEDFPKDKLMGFIRLMGNNAVDSALFVYKFETIVNEGYMMNPDSNIWYRLKPEVLSDIDNCDATEKEKDKALQNIAHLVGAPAFHLGKNENGNLIVVFMSSKEIVSFPEEYLYKIETPSYIKKIKNALFFSKAWNDFIKPMIFCIRAFKLDECKTFPKIVVKNSEDEED